MKKILIVVVLALLCSLTWAENLKFYFAYGFGYDGSGKYSIISGIFKADFDIGAATLSLDIRNQFNDWLEAYCKEAVGKQAYQINMTLGEMGPYDSQSEAESNRRRIQGQHQGPREKLVDIPRTLLPAFEWRKK
jgi:hypothetical protein